LELHCEVVMKATKVDGIYDKDPMKFPDAKRYKTMTYRDAITEPEIQVMDTAGLSMSMENNMPIQIFKLFEGDNLLRACQGEEVGTLIATDVETVLA